MELMKGRHVKKSYKPRNNNHLLKVCEIMNEEDLQEDSCFALKINKCSKNQRKSYNKKIILYELLDNKKEKISQTHTHKIKKKLFDLDGTSRLFNSIKFVH